MANYSFEAHSYTILQILQILQEHSDCNHCLTQKQIMMHLNRKYGVQVDRKKVGRDIERLREAGFEIENGEKGRGYYLTREFEESELRTLIDSVAFSKYISAQYSKQLIRKLLLFGGPGLRKQNTALCGNIAIEKNNNPDFFLNVDIISGAIEQRCQIQFIFYRYEEDAQLHSVFDKPIIVNPYALVMLRGQYCLIATHADPKDTTQSRDAFVFFSLNYIKNVKKLGPCHSTPQALQGESLTAVLNEHPFGYAGEAERVTLRIARPLIHDLIEDFGKDFTCVDNSEQTTVTVTLRAGRDDVEEWVMQHSAELLSPADLRQKIAKKAKKMYEAHRGAFHTPDHRALLRSATDQNHCLRLYRVDLSHETAFEAKLDILTAEFSENGISDFSFLVHYPNLFRLRISHNPVKDLSVLKDLPCLWELELQDLNELTSADFLGNCKTLYSLTIAGGVLRGTDLPLAQMPLLHHLIGSASVLRDMDAKRLKALYPQLSLSTDLRRLRGNPAIEFFDLVRLGSEHCRVTYPVWEAVLLHYVFGPLPDFAAIPQAYYGWLEQNENLHRILHDDVFPLLGRNGYAAVMGWVKGKTLDDIAEDIGFPMESVDHFLAFAWEVLRNRTCADRLWQFHLKQSPYAAEFSDRKA